MKGDGYDSSAAPGAVPRHPLSKVCSDLCDACCAESTEEGDGTGLDNVTAIIIELNTAGATALRASRFPIDAAGGASGGSSEMDISDDGKRKKDAEGEGRTGKQMRAGGGENDSQDEGE